jgi:Minichromosome loss protein, Mcl1, middle region
MATGKLLVMNADSTLGIVSDKNLNDCIRRNKNESITVEEAEQRNNVITPKNRQDVVNKSNTGEQTCNTNLNEAMVQTETIVPSPKTVTFAIANDEDEEEDDGSVAVSKSSKSESGAVSFHASEAAEVINNRYAEDDDEDDEDSYNQGIGQKYLECNRAVATTLPEVQAPFGISSTPLDLPRRYLCWNHIGAITLIRDENFDTITSSRNSIDIHFTDALSRRNISFTDNLGFILGALGDDGAIFATDLNDEDNDNDNEEDEEANDFVLGLSKTTQEAVKRAKRNSMKKDITTKPTGSTLFFNRFETFAHIRDKDWVITLPCGERVVGCSCGKGWAAAVTRYDKCSFWSFSLYIHSPKIIKSSIPTFFYNRWQRRPRSMSTR